MPTTLTIRDATAAVGDYQAETLEEEIGGVGMPNQNSWPIAGRGCASEA